MLSASNVPRCSLRSLRPLREIVFPNVLSGTTPQQTPRTARKRFSQRRKARKGLQFHDEHSLASRAAAPPIAAHWVRDAVHVPCCSLRSLRPLRDIVFPDVLPGKNPSKFLGRKSTILAKPAKLAKAYDSVPKPSFASWAFASPRSVIAAHWRERCCSKTGTPVR